jgi:hypothetical protein
LFGLGSSEGIRIEGRLVRERENFSVARVHHNDGTRRRLVASDGISQLALGDVLKVLVNGQLDGRASGRRPLQTAEGTAPCVFFVEQLALRATDLTVVGRFEARKALVVHPNEAEQLRRELFLGIEPPILLDEPDAIERQIGNFLALRRRHLPPHIHERSLLPESTLQRVPIFGRTVTQRMAQRCRSPRGILDLAGDAVYRLAVNAVREHSSLTIENVAALGGNRNRPRRLIFRACFEVGVPVYL